MNQPPRGGANRNWGQVELDKAFRGNEWDSSGVAPAERCGATDRTYDPLQDKHLKFKASGATSVAGSAPHRRAGAAREQAGNATVVSRRPDTSVVGAAQQRLDIRRQAYQRVVAGAVSLAALRDPSFLAATKKPNKDAANAPSAFDVFERAKGKCVALWSELSIDEAFRHHFTIQHFVLSAGEEPSAARVEAVHQEIERMLSLRRCEKGVEYSIRIREGFVYRLMDLAEKSPGLHHTEIDAQLKPLLINLRKATLDVLHSISAWRELLGYSAVYLWRGTSYIMKLSMDLESLALFPAIVQRFPCRIVGNPLLDLEVVNPHRVMYRGEAALEKPLMPPSRTSLLPPILRPAGQQPDGSVIPPEAFSRGREMLLAEPRLFADFQKTTVVHTFDLIDATTYDAQIAKQLKDVVFNEVHAALDFPHLAVGAAAAAAAGDELTPQERLMIGASIQIQRVWRGHCARKLTAVRWSEHRAAIKIQRVQRLLLAKSEVEQRRQRHLAAAKIQGLARGVATRTAMRKFHALNRVATVLQTAWRACRARRFVAFLKAVSRSARTLQRWYRGHLARRWFPVHKQKVYSSAATAIQRVWKGGALRSSKRANPSSIRAAIIIQTAWRMYSAKLFVARLRGIRDAAVTIQRFGRGVGSAPRQTSTSRGGRNTE